MAVKERLREYISYKNISISAFCNAIGVSAAYVNSMRKSIQPDKVERIALNYPDLNIEWLITGHGDMINEINLLFSDENLLFLIRLLPISATGGSLNNFTVTVKDTDCEKIISPIKGVDFALTVTGNSMFPDYPAGSKVLIKKIEEAQFIEWGRVYVLDTVNGVVIKRLVKSNTDSYRCESCNPDQERYAPFDVPKSSVFGVYRVLMVMSLK